MDSLNWRQDSKGLHVNVDCGVNGRAEFTIGNSHINFLLAGTPRMYLVFLKMNDSDQEQQFILDLDLLRPVITKANGLKISLAKKTTSQKTGNTAVVGRYCLARGESYHERFLSDTGWQSQRVYLDVYAVPAAADAAVSDVTTNTNITNNNVEPDKTSGISDFFGSAQPSGNAKAPKDDFDDLDLDLSVGGDSSLNFF